MCEPAAGDEGTGYAGESCFKRGACQWCVCVSPVECSGGARIRCVGGGAGFCVVSQSGRAVAAEPATDVEGAAAWSGEGPGDRCASAEGVVIWSSAVDDVDGSGRAFSGYVAAGDRDIGRSLGATVECGLDHEQRLEHCPGGWRSYAGDAGLRA